jgi:exonuclease III
MRIASWNINGIKARQAHLEAWLKQESPDIVCLQEIKTVDEAFPRSQGRPSRLSAIMSTPTGRSAGMASPSFPSCSSMTFIADCRAMTLTNNLA